jgi:hypothetical protein
VPTAVIKRAKRVPFDEGMLAEAVENSRRVLEVFRTNRKKFVEQYVGDQYTDTGAPAPVPVPLIAQYVQIMGRNLVTKNPRVLLSTFNPTHKPTVSAMQGWANDTIEKQNLALQFQRMAEDALFSIGIGVVALSTPSDAAVSNYNLPAGSAFLARVDLDDWVYDVTARDFEEADYEGHRYRVPIDTIRDSKLYTRARKDLKPTEYREHNESGDERITEIGRSNYRPAEMDEKVDLWQFYLPRRRLIVTYSADQSGRADQLLREQEWVGPDCGPYHHLCFNRVPGNAMPLSPIMNLYAMHSLVNNLWRKLDDQARRQKDVLLVDGKRTSDGDAIVRSNDGDAIRVDDPSSAVPVSFGGPNPNNFQFEEAAAMKFKELAGNLDSIGGLSPQAKTAKQDSMLHESAAQSVVALQETTTAFVSKALKALCWYWHHDPFKVMKTNYSVEGLPEVSIVRRVTPEQRLRVPFDSLGVKVDPYSMLQATPQSRAAALDAVVRETIMPMMALLQQQGVQFNIEKYLKFQAEYRDMPDLSEVVSLAEPPEEESERTPGEGSGMGATMPQKTERSYVRENRSERTSRGNNLMLQNALMGVNSGGRPNSSIPAQGPR